MLSGNSAPDGIMGPYRQPEGSTLTIKEVWSPIVFTDAAPPPGTNPTLHVDNRYDFLDLQQCGFVWELRRFVRPRDSSSGYTVSAQGTVTTGSIPARTSGTLTLSLPSQLGTADALAVRAIDPSGSEVWTKVWALPTADAFRTATAPAGRSPVTATDAASTILVRSSDLVVTISKTTGQLTAVNRGGHPYSLANGPRLVTGTATLTGISHQAVGGDQVITATYSGNLRTVTWHVRRSGWVQVDSVYNLNSTAGQNFFGVGFDYPEANVQSMRWLGDGPYRTYKNRRQGATTNVWQNTYNNTATGGSLWVYPEFKGYYGNVRWAQFQTTEGLITAELGADSQFLQVFTPATISGQPSNTTVAYPSASLSILDAIPPMGSKFAAPGTTGPAGQQAVASGTYTDSVSFYFGPLP